MEKDLSCWISYVVTCGNICIWNRLERKSIRNWSEYTYCTPSQYLLKRWKIYKYRIKIRSHTFIQRLIILISSWIFTFIKIYRHGKIDFDLEANIWWAQTLACCRPPQDVDAVLDFQIPCFRPETPALYPRSFVTNHKGRGRKLGRPRRL